jgi:large subunit ribosomal protein L22
MSEEPEKTDGDDAEETEAVAADAAGAGADAPEAAATEEPEPEAAQEAPKPRRRRRKAAEPAAEEAPADPDLEAATEAEDEAEAEAAGEEPEAEEPVAEAQEAVAEEAAPAKPTRTAPSRRRARRDPSLPAPVVRAQAKYVRSSARKARLVCDHIRGKSVEEARAILALTPRAIARDWSKLLESAVANAEHNHELVGEDLYVKAVHADEGPTIKRFRPRAMGRATRIRKRTSHLTILLTPKD